MLKELLYLLLYVFGITWWVTLPILLLFILAILYVAILLFLDLLYKKQESHPTYNIILDRIMPFILIISPCIIVMNINIKDVILIYKIFYLIIIHITIVLPIIYYWSKHRNYHINITKKELTYVSWKHPILSFYITIALIYLYLWGFYFSAVRFLRLGMKSEIYFFDIFNTFSCTESVIILLLFLNIWQTIFIWGLIIFSIFMTIKKNIMGGFFVVIHSLHIQFLNNDRYVNIMEKLYKIQFILYNMICLNAPLNIHKPYISYNIIRRLLHNIYYRPYILYIIPLISILFEILIYHKIYFTFYILFFLPIFLSCCKGLYLLGISFLIKDVCMVDYQRQNIQKIRYKPTFWKYIENPDLFYGFSIIISNQQYTLWEQEFNKFSYKNQIYSYKLSEQLFNRINKLQEKYPYSIHIYWIRIKAAYYKTYYIRWNYKKTKH